MGGSTKAFANLKLLYGKLAIMCKKSINKRAENKAKEKIIFLKTQITQVSRDQYWIQPRHYYG